MKHTRRLGLKREILTELTAAELTSVNGATHSGCNTTDLVTHASFDSPCPSIPINPCISIPSCWQTT